MELFSISCTTCKSRLKVREESAIGQILACPKCGGMVMVKPPEGWQNGGPPPIPQPESPPGLTAVVDVPRPGDTIGDSQFDDVDELLSDAPPRVRPGTVTVAADAPGLARPRFAGSPAQSPPRSAGEGSAIHARGTNSAPTSSSAKPHQTPDKAAADAHVTPPPESAARAGDQVESPPVAESRPGRYWVLLSGSIAAGILLAVLAVAGVMRFLQSPPHAFSQPARQVANSTPSSQSPVAGAPAEQTPSSPLQPTEATPEQPASGETVVGPPGPVQPSETEPPAAEPSETEPSETEPTPAAPMPKPMAGSDPLQPFENILATDTADPFANPDAATTPVAPPSEALVPMATEPDSEPAKPSLPRPAPRVVDVAARLADPLPAIEATGVPLADFLKFIADYSTIPITLEADALPFARSSSVAPVNAKATNSTVGGVLAAALTPLGLESIAAEGQLVVRVIEPSPLPTLRYPISDLTGEDESAAAELAEALQALVEPASWTGEGAGSLTVGKGELAIAQRRSVHLQLVTLCEKLRTARKLRPKTSFDPALFKLDTRSQRAAAKLLTPISLNFSQPTSFVRIVERLEQVGGMRILIDWRDIASAGWNPDGEATLLVDKEPFSAALAKLLEPMDLAYRIVDHQTLQIVTPLALASRTDLELYKVDDLTDADPSGASLVAQVRAALGEGQFRDNGGNCEIRFDEPSRSLIASLPQPQQQALESLLTKLRSGK
jgi:DNA-directed RNA polymerase subunit RPC12/RpoP